MAKRKENINAEPTSKKNKKSLKDTVNNDNASNQIKGIGDKPKVKEEKRRKYEKALPNALKENRKRDMKDEKGNDKSSSETEKPNWMEIKKQKKELKEKYKAKKLNNIYDVTIRAKQIGEKLRRSDCKPLERKKLILQVHDLLKSHYSKVMLTHDLSRIIQWMIKYGDQQIQKDIFSELKPTLVDMISSKYAKNCVKGMLKYGPWEMKHEIISACYGKVVKLMSHSISAPLLELMYTKYAKHIEKVYFKQEFYGDMYKQAKDKGIKSLTDVFKSAENMKSATLSAVKGNLTRILNKNLSRFTFVQCILLEYLNECSTEDRSEMIAMLKDSIVELSQTKPGSKIVVLCIWHSTNKDRKTIMKGLKENVKTVSMSEHGHLILLALFDSVDDTVLVKKIILSEIQKDLTEIALNEHGKNVILYLVARRSPRYFHPSTITYLQQGDKNETSKKPADIKEKELVEGISNTLLETLVQNTATWMSNSSIAMVTLAVLNAGSGEKLKQAFESIAKYITDSQTRIKEGDAEHKVVEHAGLHMMLKKLIQNDEKLQGRNETTFGEILTSHLNVNIIQEWIESNRGCFLLIFLLENETASTVQALHSKLKPVKNALASKTSPGAAILLKKLS
ncbi:PREDICTED: protein penguin [Dufourea novaeangliae]|uniref:Protein penguin n=1 Tax=Dufourea novaeangliae TaxID=178035 RepID=A0A154PGZ6_DUFNO|nr:PREDICTED: protein penguin [Dufourea novaeangliae]KZC10744.1 Protein penguin [Dufourea novaeangliae]